MDEYENSVACNMQKVISAHGRSSDVDAQIVTSYATLQQVVRFSISAAIHANAHIKQNQVQARHRPLAVTI